MYPLLSGNTKFDSTSTRTIRVTLYKFEREHNLESHT